jgi:hypothetical protein
VVCLALALPYLVFVQWRARIKQSAFASPLDALRAVGSAEVLYRVQRGTYGKLPELQDAGLISCDVASDFALELRVSPVEPEIQWVAIASSNDGAFLIEPAGDIYRLASTADVTTFAAPANATHVW